MPLGDRIDNVGPPAGFLDFGFFGSRLPRFCPLAILSSGAVDWDQCCHSKAQALLATLRACVFKEALPRTYIDSGPETSKRCLRPPVDPKEK